MDDFKGISYSYSYTQPYNTWNSPLNGTSFNPFYDNHLRVCQEMLLMNEIDKRVEMMTSYPDAEAIIEKVCNGTDS